MEFKKMNFIPKMLQNRETQLKNLIEKTKGWKIFKMEFEIVC